MLNETEKNDKMNNVERVRQSLIEAKLDAVLITDEKNQRYATGFAFTDGAVLEEKCVFVHRLPLYRGGFNDGGG